MVQRKQQIAPYRPGVNGFGHFNSKQTLTIHQTGNKNPSADAQMHANLQSRVYSASWHWQVDDKVAIQSFAHTWSAWHAGDGRGNGNMHSIGIEICINQGANYVQAVKNGAKLAAWILKTENIPLNKMVRHYDWTRKWCPAQIMNGQAGINWQDFQNLVKAELGKLNGQKVSLPNPTPKPQPKNLKSDYQLAQEVIDGKHGNGEQRKLSLGNRYSTVQTLVNQILQGKAPKPQVKKPQNKRLHLPKTAERWAIYKPSGPYTLGNQIGYLAPAKFGGLTYTIKGSPMKDVQLIDTRDFGRVAIYTGQGTGAVIT